MSRDTALVSSSHHGRTHVCPSQISPGDDGTYMREVLVPKNTNVIVSILNSNRDPGIWGDDALEWKPERWLSPLPQSVVDAGIPLSPNDIHWRRKSVHWIHVFRTRDEDRSLHSHPDIQVHSHGRDRLDHAGVISECQRF